MMATIGLYIRGFDQEHANALRLRLNEIAAEFGYTSERGPTAGEGNLTQMLIAIDEGELALVLLPDEQRAWAINWLDEQAAALRENADSWREHSLSDALTTIADALVKAQEREEQTSYEG
jgi:hypothetical protein